MPICSFCPYGKGKSGINVHVTILWLHQLCRAASFVERSHLIIRLLAEHQFHMECFEPWFKNNKFCPYCRKAIKHFKKKLKLLSKTCERCGNGPSNFVTRCHHFIHTKLHKQEDSIQKMSHL